MSDIPTKDLNEFDAVTPTASDNLICGRGRFTVGQLSELSANAIKIKVRHNGAVVPNKYGYVVLEEDDDGNISPTYLNQEEYNALS